MGNQVDGGEELDVTPAYEPGTTLVLLHWNVDGSLLREPEEWSAILTLARNSGWQPCGTLRPTRLPPLDPTPEPGPIESTWDGRYEPPCGQRLTDEDAFELRCELLRALDMLQKGEPVPRSSIEARARLLKTPGDGKRVLDFTDLCCKGGFSIDLVNR